MSPSTPPFRRTRPAFDCDSLSSDGRRCRVRRQHDRNAPLAHGLPFGLPDGARVEIGNMLYELISEIGMNAVRGPSPRAFARSRPLVATTSPAMSRRAAWPVSGLVADHLRLPRPSEQDADEACSACGRPRSTWTSRGIARDGRKYCCAGCANDAECSGAGSWCSQPAPIKWSEMNVRRKNRQTDEPQAPGARPKGEPVRPDRTGSPAGTTGSSAHREDSSHRGNDANRFGSGRALNPRAPDEEIDRMINEGGATAPAAPPTSGQDT